MRIQTEYVAADDGHRQLIVEDCSTVCTSHCENCGKIAGSDVLMPIQKRGVVWMVCSYECAEEI